MIETTAATQESLVVLLCYDEEYAPKIASLVTPGLFDPVFKKLAEKALDYRAKFKQVPGEQTFDLFEEAKSEDPDRAELYDQLFRSVQSTVGKINAPYFVDKAREFARRQTLHRTLATTWKGIDRDDGLLKAEAQLREWLDGASVADRPAPRARTAKAMLRAFRKGKLRKRPVLVEGLLRERDLLVLFGPPGMGKSQLALALGASLAVGRTRTEYVLPHDDTPLWRIAREDGVRVLVLSGEDDEADVAERLAGFLAARGVGEDLRTLRVATPRDGLENLTTHAGRTYLDGIVREHKPDVVFIDNVTTVCAGLDKSDESAVAEWIAQVPRRLRDHYGCTVVLLAHANKGNGKDDGRAALDRLFGSQAWAALADGAVLLDYVPDEPCRRRIEHAKARGFGAFPALKVQAPQGDCVFPIIKVDDGATTTHRLKATDAEIVDALKVFAAKGEAKVERSEVLGQINAERATHDREAVGRTAFESAIVALAKMPGAGFDYQRGGGRRNPWLLWLVDLQSPSVATPQKPTSRNAKKRFKYLDGDAS
jgi:hypothetical protein